MSFFDRVRLGPFNGLNVAGMFVTLSRPNRVERPIDGGAIQIALYVFLESWRQAISEQTQEYRLQHILCVCRVIQQTVGCAVQQLGMFPKQLLEFLLQGHARHTRCHDGGHWHLCKENERKSSLSRGG